MYILSSNPKFQNSGQDEQGFNLVLVYYPFKHHTLYSFVIFSVRPISLFSYRPIPITTDISDFQIGRYRLWYRYSNCHIGRYRCRYRYIVNFKNVILWRKMNIFFCFCNMHFKHCFFKMTFRFYKLKFWPSF